MLKIIFLTFLSFAYACKPDPPPPPPTTTTTTTTTLTTASTTSTTAASTTASTTTTTTPTSATRIVNSTTAATNINDTDINISIGMTIFLIIVIGSISFFLLRNCQKNNQEKQQENIAAKDKRRPNTRSTSSSKDKEKRLSASGDYLNYSGVGSTIGCYGPVINEMTSFDPSKSTHKTTTTVEVENIALLEANDICLPKWPEEDVPGPETRVEIIGEMIQNVSFSKTANNPMLENLEEKNPPDDDDASEKIAEIKPSDALEGVVVSENATSGDGLLRDEKPPRKVSQSSTISAYDRMLSQL